MDIPPRTIVTLCTSDIVPNLKNALYSLTAHTMSVDELLDRSVCVAASCDITELIRYAEQIKYRFQLEDNDPVMINTLLMAWTGLTQHLMTRVMDVFGPRHIPIPIRYERLRGDDIVVFRYLDQHLPSANTTYETDEYIGPLK